MEEGRRSIPIVGIQLVTLPEEVRDVHQVDNGIGWRREFTFDHACIDPEGTRVALCAAITDSLYAFTLVCMLRPIEDDTTKASSEPPEAGYSTWGGEKKKNN